MNRKQEIVTRCRPANFVVQDEPLFAGELDEQFYAPQIRRLENIKISAEGILFQNNRIMVESFSREENFQRSKRRSVLKTYVQNVLFRPTRKIDSVIWVTDDWSTGYFHWLSDVLPKLVIASEHIANSTVLLPSHFRDLDMVKYSLERFGTARVQFINNNESVTALRLYLPTHAERSGDFNEAVIKQVRCILRDPFLRADSPPKRVYISRRKARRRKVVNEDEVINVLRSFDFEIVFAEDLSFLAQVQLFSSVRHLVSIHGAGLSNMLFMPDDSSVMEFRKNDPTGTNCFFNMASALGHKFYYQLCDAEDRMTPPHVADLIVDTRKLTENLEHFLGGMELENKK